MAATTLPAVKFEPPTAAAVRVTLPVKPASPRCSDESRATTWTLNSVPDAMLAAGLTVKNRWSAAGTATVTLKALLTAPVSPGEAAVTV